MKGFGTRTEKENPPLNQTYPGRIVHIIDIGHQPNFDTAKPPVHQLMVGVELCDPDVRRKDGTPFIVSAYQTMSNHSNAGIMAWTQGLNNRQFDVGDKDKQGTGFFYKLPEDFVEGCLKAMLGMPVLALIVPNGQGNAKISSLSRPPKGFAVPEADSALTWFDLEDTQNFQSNWNALPEWIQKVLAKATEFAPAPQQTVGMNKQQDGTMPNRSNLGPNGQSPDAQMPAGMSEQKPAASGHAHQDDIPY